jgi:hypothetical protein
MQYTSGYGGPEGLCRLYVRMASVAESVIHHKGLTGHENDTILVGVPHRMLDSNGYYLISGSRWVRDCYQIATEPGGPGIFWDGISFHPYQKGVGFNPNTLEETAESVRTIARQFGDYDCQVWCTEVSVFPEDQDSKQHFQMRYLPQVYTTALAPQALPGPGAPLPHVGIYTDGPVASYIFLHETDRLSSPGPG